MTAEENNCSPAVSPADIYEIFDALICRLEDIAEAIDDNTEAVKNQTTAMQIITRRR